MENLNGTIDTGQIRIHTTVENIRLACGEKYQIANGFHSGESSISCKSLAEQTVATATNDHIAAGSRGYVNGLLITGSLPVRNYLMDVSSMQLNSDGSVGVAFPRGIYMTNHPDYSCPIIRGSQTAFASVGKLTSAKIAKGKSYLGIAGTYTADATVVASDVKKGKTVYSNGVLITGTLITQAPTNGSIQTNGPSSITISWYNPPIGPFGGVQIRMSTTGYPGKSSGTVVYTGTGSNAIKNGRSSVAITGLSSGTQYYFTVYGQCGALDTSEGVLNLTERTAVAQGSQTFLSSGIFTVPEYVYEVEVCVVGAGGGTGRTETSSSSNQTWGIGGSGGYVKNEKVSVTPGQQIAIVVGAPIHPIRTNEEIEFSYFILAKSSYPDWPTDTTEQFWTANGSHHTSSVNIARSGSSMFGSVEAKGGAGCSTARGLPTGMPGGSGSAGAYCMTRNEYYPDYLRVGNPGSNGSNGGNTIGDQGLNWVLSIGGTGQAESTYGFGNSQDTLYSTAGRTAVYNTRCTAGEDNTGNGALGGGWTQYKNESALGGSGIVRVRWGN